MGFLLSADSDLLTSSLLRWAHIISGIAWIGMLYFFNLVNVPMQGKLDGPTKKAVNPELLPRALWWFRWGAMSTLVFGLVLFWWKYMRKAEGTTYNALFKDPDGHITDRAWWILFGMLLGLIMWFNVWFIIWPKQRVIIRATRDGQKPPEGFPEKAKLFSRINFMLSGPMLGGMVAANNLSTMNWTNFLVVVIVSSLVAHLALRAGPKVGTTI